MYRLCNSRSAARGVRRSVVAVKTTRPAIARRTSSTRPGAGGAPQPPAAEPLPVARVDRTQRLHREAPRSRVPCGIGSDAPAPPLDVDRFEEPVAGRGTPGETVGGFGILGLDAAFTERERHLDILRQIPHHASRRGPVGPRPAAVAVPRAPRRPRV